MKKKKKITERVLRWKGCPRLSMGKVSSVNMRTKVMPEDVTSNLPLW